MRLKQIIIYGLSVIALASCNKDFLEKSPLGVENNLTFYKDEVNCEQAVNAIYDPAQWLNMYSRNYWGIGDVCSDDAEKGGQDETDQPSMQELQTFNMTSNNTYLTDMWRGFYIGIGRANEMLYRTESGDVDFDEDKLLRLRGEARFLRAFYYFDLVKIFGPVPLIEQPLQPGEGALIGNRSDDPSETPAGDLQKAKVLQFIVDELEDIQATWPLDVATNVGRVNKPAVLGLLTKAYVWQKDWTNALRVAEELIVQFPTLSVHYQDIFALENEMSEEVLFAIQFVDGQTGEDYDRNGEGTERCTYVNVRTVLSVDNNSQQFMGEKGYGFNIPRQELIDLFDAGDPRLDVVVSEGDSLWWNFDYKIAGAELQKHPVVFPSAHTGHYCLKGTVDYDQFSTAKPQSTGLDYPLIRLGDIYLFAAEAALKVGDVAKATQYVNAVRARARNSARIETGFRQYEPVISTVPADLPIVDEDIIFEERRRELFCEGHRFFDITRSGRTDEMSDKTEDSFGQPIKFDPQVNTVFPIPLSEITRHTGGNLIQNPGY